MDISDMNKDIAKVSLPGVLLPFLVIILSVGIFYFNITNTYPKVSKNLTEMKKVKQNEKILNEKYNTLTTLDSGLLEKTNKMLVVLPEKNYSPYVISNIRRFATEYEYELTKINLKNSSNKKEMTTSAVTINVDAKGPNWQSLADLMKRIKNSVPINTIEDLSAKKENTEEIISCKFSINTYFSEFPKEITQISEAITDLSGTENEIYLKANSFEEPEKILLEPSSDVERVNPFL